MPLGSESNGPTMPAADMPGEMPLTGTELASQRVEIARAAAEVCPTLPPTLPPTDIRWSRRLSRAGAPDSDPSVYAFYCRYTGP